MRIPQFSLRVLLLIVAACSLLFWLFSMRVADPWQLVRAVWAGVAALCVFISLSSGFYAITQACLWLWPASEPPLTNSVETFKVEANLVANPTKDPTIGNSTTQ